MRSAIIGAVMGNQPGERDKFVRASCLLTHTDLRAEEAALLVAEASSLAAENATTDAALKRLKAMIHSKEMRSHFDHLECGLHLAALYPEPTHDVG